METGPHEELRFCETEGLDLIRAGTDALEQGGHRKRVRTYRIYVNVHCALRLSRPQYDGHQMKIRMALKWAAVYDVAGLLLSACTLVHNQRLLLSIY
jgi:hypothetical protein